MSSPSNKKSLLDLTGLGEKRQKQLQDYGITTRSELVSHVPVRYEDRTQILSLAELEEGERAVICCMVRKIGRVVYLAGKRTLVRVEVEDETGTLGISYFYQPYIRQQLRVGAFYYFYGMKQNGQMINPQSAPSSDASFLRISPLYSLPKGISQLQFQRWALQILQEDEDALVAFPHCLHQHFAMPPQREIFTELHAPHSTAALLRAKQYLQLQRMLRFVLQNLYYRRMKDTRATQPIGTCKLADFYQQLPFSLRDEQMQVIEEIATDLAHGRMNRLLQGDVGTGKTVVAFAAAYMVLKAGYSVCFMAPTEVLAQQHAENARRWFENLGLPVECLSGRLQEKDRRAFYDRLSTQGPTLIFGTHALLYTKVPFEKVGLVITDEQHRFGVEQRRLLQEESGETEVAHHLVLSATPIPRTLYLVALGDLQLSRLRERPLDKKPIDTYVVSPKWEKRLYRFAFREAAQGHASFFICPRIEEDEEDLSRWSVESVHRRILALAEEEQVPCKIGMLHGRMHAEQKEEIMQSLRDGKIDILISTTVIEVGVDIPQATFIGILSAERFGLAQLHQLRGRVGRNRLNAYCALLMTQNSKTALSRLQGLAKTQDGYEIAKQDLRSRGVGDRYGVRQHGNLQEEIWMREEDLIALRNRLLKNFPDLFEGNPQDATLCRWIFAEKSVLFYVPN